jgi:hypothetical protein
MLNLGVFLTIVLGAASVLFYTADELRGGRVGWANDVCDAALPLCQHPEWPATAAALLICVVGVAMLAVGSRG